MPVDVALGCNILGCIFRGNGLVGALGLGEPEDGGFEIGFE